MSFDSRSRATLLLSGFVPLYLGRKARVSRGVALRVEPSSSVLPSNKSIQFCNWNQEVPECPVWFDKSALYKAANSDGGDATQILGRVLNL